MGFSGGTFRSLFVISLRELIESLTFSLCVRTLEEEKTTRRGPDICSDHMTSLLLRRLSMENLFFFFDCKIFGALKK